MKKKIKYKGWIFYNFPEKLSKKDYDDVEREILKKIKNIPEILVYVEHIRKMKDFAPGFSDIDYVVSTNEINKELSKIFSIKFAKGKEKEVLYHDALIIPKNILKKFKKLLGKNKKDWQLLRGQNIKFEKSTKTDYDFRMWEDFVLYDTRHIYTMLLTKEVDIRSAGHKLNSLKHKDHIFLKHEFLLKKRIEKYIERVRILRKMWFENEMKINFEELIYLLNENIKIIEILLPKYSKYLNTKYINKDKLSDNYFGDASFPCIFKKYDNYFAQTKKVYDKHKIIICFYPPEFFSIFSEYKEQKGVIADYLKKITKKSEISLKEEYKSTAKERLNTYTQQLNFCKNNNWEYGPLISFNLHEKAPNIRKKITRGIKKNMMNYKVKKIIKEYV